MENKRATSSNTENRPPKLRKVGEVDSKNSDSSARKLKESPFSWSCYENKEETYMVRVF